MRARPKVALTTTRDRGRDLAPIANELGMEPVALPCVGISPSSPSDLRRVRKSCGEADILFITSSRTIEILWEGDRMPSVPVAVVGQMTARCARKHGGELLEVGDLGSVDLAKHIVESVEGKRVVYPGSSTPNSAAESVLRESASKLVSEVVYQTSSIAPGTEPVDAAAFGSPSAVAGWAMGRGFNEILIGSIGETTSTSLRELGVEPDVEPASPGYRGLLALIADEFERKEVRT